MSWLIRRYMRKFGFVESDFEHLHVVVRNDGVVELSSLVPEVKWRPWPKVRLSKELYGTLNFDQFFQLIVAAPKKAAFQSLGQRLGSGCALQFQQVGEEARATFLKILGSSLQRIFEGEAAKLSSHNPPVSVAAAKEVLQNTLDEALVSFREEVITAIRDSVNAVLADFVSQMLSDIREKFFVHRRMYNSDGSIGVLPDGTRFFTAEGQTGVLVIEEPPKPRTVMFSSSFLDKEQGRHKQEVFRTQFRVGFPYIIFFLKFVEGKYHSTSVFYSKTPLSSLDNELLYANLPNIHPNHQLCAGNSFRAPAHGTIAERTRIVLSHFWLSEFNNDLRAQYYLPVPKGGKTLENVWDWEQLTAIDPLFALQAKWKPADVKVKDVVKSLCEESSTDELGAFNTLARDIVKSRTKEIPKQIAERVMNEIGVKGRFGKTVTRQLGDRLQAVLNEVWQPILDQLMHVSTAEPADTARLSDVIVEAAKVAATKLLQSLDGEIKLDPAISSEALMQRRNFQEVR